MLYGHFAVCGDEQRSPICCVCGLIAEADDWDRFDRAWRAALPDSGTGFRILDCFHGTGAFQSWDFSHRIGLLERLSEVLTHSGAVPMGAVVVREDFSRLLSAEHAILAGENIESPLDLIFYDLTERIIHRVHEESEKVSLLFDQEPPSAAEHYNKLFHKHLSRFLLGPHLMGALAFADASGCTHLQAAKLLGETVLLTENQRSFAQNVSGSSFPVPGTMLQLSEQIRQQGHFDAAGLHKLSGKLKGHSAKSSKST